MEVFKMANSVFTNTKRSSLTWFKEVRSGSHRSRLTIGVPTITLQVSTDITLYGFKEGDIFGAETYKVVKKKGTIKRYCSYTVAQVRKSTSPATGTQIQKSYSGADVLLEVKGVSDVREVRRLMETIDLQDLNEPVTYETIRILIEAFKREKEEDIADLICDTTL